MELLENPLAVPIIVTLLVIAIIGFTIVKNFRIAKPNEALVITGKSANGVDTLTSDTVVEDGVEVAQSETSGARVIIGGRAFVRPFLDRVFSMDLSSRQIHVDIRGYSVNGIDLKVAGVAQVKIGGTVTNVRRAAQRFLDDQSQIDNFCTEILAGTLRSVVGTLTVEEIIQDRVAFAEKVREESAHSMNNQGLVIDTFQITSVSDDNDYLRNWGRPKQAEVAKLAEIAEAVATRESTERRNAEDLAVQDSNLTVESRKAEIQKEISQRRAEAEASEELAKAQQREQILVKQRELALREAELKEQDLVTEVHKPAEAEKYRRQQEADAAKYEAEQRALAEKNAAVLRAEADFEVQKQKSEAVKVAALADADSVKARGEAEAKRLSALNTAEAEGISAKGEAEASALQKKAEAYKSYNDAAVLDKVLSTLPEIAAKLAEPYSNIKELSIVSSDGEAKIGKNIAVGLTQTLDMVKSMTGIDIEGTLKDLSNINNTPATGIESAPSNDVTTMNSTSAK